METTETRTSTSASIKRPRSSAYSIVTSSSRVSRRPRTAAPSRASAPLRPCAGSGGEPSVTAPWLRATVEQEAGDEPDGGGDAYRAPRVVVDVVVGCSSRRFRFVHGLGFDLLQPKLRVQELGFNLGAQVLGFLARLRRGALQHFLRFGQHGGKIVDEFFAGRICSGHG